MSEDTGTGAHDAVDVPIRDESIRLGQFLKLANLIETGSDAKPLLADGRGERQRRGRDPPGPPAGAR